MTEVTGIHATSVMMKERGTLYVCATPIGNMEDVSRRLITVLSTVHGIAAEDTRHTQKLLNYYGIKTQLISYHHHNEQKRSEQIIGKLLDGHDIALVSDAGTPVVSDPGAVIVARARESGIPIVPIPGPSAVTAALSVSGFTDTNFCFLGFWSRDNKEKSEQIEVIESYPGVIVLYESPYRLAKTLVELSGYFPSYRVVIARELTKLHEEIYAGDLAEAAKYFSQKDVKGEITIILRGKVVKAIPEKEEMLAYIEFLESRGKSKMDALKSAAKVYGVKKRELYNLYEDDSLYLDS